MQVFSHPEQFEGCGLSEAFAHICAEISVISLCASGAALRTHRSGSPASREKNRQLGGLSISNVRLGLPESNGSRQRSRTCTNGMSVVTALDDPLTIFLADYLADMVSPNDDCADRGSASIRSVVGPRPRQIVFRARISTNLASHVPAAPSAGAVSVVVSTIKVMVM